MKVKVNLLLCEKLVCSHHPFVTRATHEKLLIPFTMGAIFELGAGVAEVVEATDAAADAATAVDTAVSDTFAAEYQAEMEAAADATPNPSYIDSEAWTPIT